MFCIFCTTGGFFTTEPPGRSYRVVGRIKWGEASEVLHIAHSQHKSNSSKALVALLCQTLCNPMDWSPPGSSVHGILQARTLEWVAIPFSRGSSWPRDRTWVSSIEGLFFFLTDWATREAHIKVKGWYYYFCDHPFVCLSRVLEALRLPVLWRGFSASATMVIMLTKPLRELATPGGPLGHLASPSFPATALMDLCPFSHHS